MQPVEAATGQAIRYEVRADREGYLTVLNFGAQANVEVFLPQDPRLSRRVVPGRAETLVTALAPPAGKEFTAVIWTRQPSQLNGDEWQERIGAAGRAGKWSYWRSVETVRGTGRRSWSRYCSVPGIGETRNSRRTNLWPQGGNEGGKTASETTT